MIISRAGKPVARLTNFQPLSEPRDLGAGSWEGRVWMADDFDELPEKVLELFAADAGPADDD